MSSKNQTKYIFSIRGRRVSVVADNSDEAKKKAVRVYLRRIRGNDYREQKGGEGCRHYAKRNRRTGTETGAYDNEAQGLCTEGGKWGAVCWTHSTTVSTNSVKMAIHCAKNPDEFCDSCRKIAYPNHREVLVSVPSDHTALS